MPQLHFSVDEATARRLSEAASVKKMSISKYIAELVKGRMEESWPAGYLEEVVGGCSQHPLEEPAELELDDVRL